ncbi:MAG: hydrogenase maturation protease [Acidobacteriota bacterium]
MTRILIGTGNLHAGDDAAGLFVARKARPRLPTDVRVVEAAGDGAGLLDVWSEGDDVILVDAAVSGSLPGTIHQFDAMAGPVPARFNLRSSHAFGVAPGIELARALSRLPGRLTLFAIEADSFGTGAPPTPGVRRAIDEVVDAVVASWGERMHLHRGDAPGDARS